MKKIIIILALLMLFTTSVDAQRKKSITKHKTNKTATIPKGLPLEIQEEYSFIKSEMGEIKAFIFLGLWFEKNKDYEHAFYWFRKAAEKGDKDSQHHLGLYYSVGWGIPKDISKALFWFQVAAENGQIDAQYNLGMYYARNQDSSDISKALYWFRNAAELGDIKSQAALGEWYYNSKNYNQAIYWFHRAIDNNTYTIFDIEYGIRSRKHLGDCYFYGHGVTQDYKQAFQWYQKAAPISEKSLNECPVCKTNGTLPYKSVGVSQFRSYYNLGLCYYYGLGIQRDYEQAFHWFQHGSDTFQTSLFSLTYTISNGQSTTSNDQNQSPYQTDQYQSTYYMGLCYEHGRGVAKNHDKAVELWQSIELLNPNARRELERLGLDLKSRIDHGYPELKMHDIITDESKVRSSSTLKIPKRHSAQTEEVYSSAAHMPSFPGGDDALMRYLSSHIRYPEAAAKNNIQGKVLVQMVIRKDGSVGEVRIARSVCEELDREAIRVCKSLPKFTPGRNAIGDLVNAWYTLPVTFKLQGAN